MWTVIECFTLLSHCLIDRSIWPIRMMVMIFVIRATLWVPNACVSVWKMRKIVEHLTLLVAVGDHIHGMTSIHHYALSFVYIPIFRWISFGPRGNATSTWKLFLTGVFVFFSYLHSFTFLLVPFISLVAFRFVSFWMFDVFRFSDKVQMQPTSIYQALTEGKTKSNAHTEVVSCKYITVSFYFGISQNNS